MGMSAKQAAILEAAEAKMKATNKGKVNAKTQQPPGVPAFNPGVEGYDPQTGEVNKPVSPLESTIVGAGDMPILGPAINAASNAGAAALDTAVDAITGKEDNTPFKEKMDKADAYGKKALADNPKAAAVGRLAGSVAVGSALPVPGSVAGAAGMGGAIMGGDDVLRSGLKGELPDPTKLAVDTAMGAAGGVVGHYLGKAVSSYMEAKGLGNKPLSEAAKRVIEERRSIENAAGDAMDASNVVISKDALQDLAHDTITKLAPEGLSRQTSPDAWKAAKLLLQAAGRDQDVTLRQFNQLRQNMRDALPMSASGTEYRLVGKMGEDMNSFITSLPKGNPAVVLNGDAQAGVNAWQQMNKFHMERLKGEALSRLFYQSEIEASKGGTGKSFGQILQDNAAQFLTRTSGKAEDELSLFGPKEMSAIEDFVKGNKSVVFDNMIDKYIGSGIVSTPFRATIRGGAALIKSATGGGDVATRSAGLDLLREGGAAASIPEATVPNLSAPAAALAGKLSQSVQDTQSKIDAILEGERAMHQQQKMQLPPSFPKATVVPPPQQ